MSSLKFYSFFILAFGVFLVVNGAASGGGTPPPSNHCPEGDVCWVMQATNLESRKKVGDPCSITRVINARNDTDKLNSVNGGIDPSDNSTSNSTELDEPPEELVIDDCQDEENRSFMECVLNFKPSITEADADYHKGVCMCYRDWSINSNRSPAYNHSLNYTKESHEWFFFSEKYNECIVRNRKRCAPGGTQIVPYRCEDIKDPETNKSREATCSDSDVDPHFMICGGRRNEIFMTPFAVVSTICFNFITQNFAS